MNKNIMNNLILLELAELVIKPFRKYVMFQTWDRESGRMIYEIYKKELLTYYFVLILIVYLIGQILGVLF